MSATVNSYGTRLGMAVAIEVAPGASVQNLNVISRAVGRTRSRFQSLRYALNDVKYGMDNLRTAVRPFAMAGGIAAMLGVREAFKYDKALHEVGAAIGRAKFEAQRGEIDRLIRMTALQKENVASVEEATIAYQVLARSGYGEGAKASQALGTVLKMITNDADLSAKSAATALIKIKEGFGLADSQIQRVGDTLARTSDAIPGNISDLVNAMKYLGPAVSQRQGTLEEAMVLSAVGISRGLAPSTAGTAFNQLMAQMSKKGKREKLEDTLGISITNKETGEWKGLAYTMDAIVTGLEKMSNVDASDLITDVFGIRPARGLAKFMTGLTTGGAAFEQFMDYVTKGADLREKSEIISDSLSSIAKAYGSAASSMAIDFFGEMFNNKELTEGRNNLIKIAEALLLLRKGESEGDILQLNEGMKQSHIDTANTIKKVAGEVAEVFNKIWVVIKKVADFVGADFLISFVALSPIIAIVSGILGVVSNLVRGLGLLGLAPAKMLPDFKTVFAAIGAGAKGVLKNFLLAGSSWSGLRDAWGQALAPLKRLWDGVATFGRRALASRRQVSQFRIDLAMFNLTSQYTGVRLRFAAAGFVLMRAGAAAANIVMKSLMWTIRAILGPIGIIIGIIAELAGAFDSSSDSIDEAARSLENFGKTTDREKQIGYLTGDDKLSQMYRDKNLGGRGPMMRMEAIEHLDKRDSFFNALGKDVFAGGAGLETFRGMEDYSRVGKTVSAPFSAEDLGKGGNVKAQRATDLIESGTYKELARLQGSETRTARSMEIFAKLAELTPNSFKTMEEATLALGLTAQEAKMMAPHFEKLNSAIAKAKDANSITLDDLQDTKTLRNFFWATAPEEAATATPKEGTDASKALEYLRSRRANELKLTLEIIGLEAGKSAFMGGEAAGEAEGMRKPCIDAHLTTNLDGKKIGAAVAQVNMDVARRGGANMTPYQRVKILQNGSTAPVVPGGSYA